MWHDIVHRTGEDEIPVVVSPEGVLDARRPKPGCRLGEVSGAEHVHDPRKRARLGPIRRHIESRVRSRESSECHELSSDACAEPEDLASVQPISSGPGSQCLIAHLTSWVCPGKWDPGASRQFALTTAYPAEVNRSPDMCVLRLWVGSGVLWAATCRRPARTLGHGTYKRTPSAPAARHARTSQVP